MNIQCEKCGANVQVWRTLDGGGDQQRHLDPELPANWRCPCCGEPGHDSQTIVLTCPHCGNAVFTGTVREVKQMMGGQNEQ